MSAHSACAGPPRPLNTSATFATLRDHRGVSSHERSRKSVGSTCRACLLTPVATIFICVRQARALVPPSLPRIRLANFCPKGDLLGRSRLARRRNSRFHLLLIDPEYTVYQSVLVA